MIPQRDRQILVVDDDEENLKLLAKVLTFDGYKVELANSGERALQKFAQNSPDLVLLDVSMPGISGLDTLKILREKNDYVAVIFVSGNTQMSDIIKGLDYGADDYIRKPYDVYELLARVRAKLRIKDLHDDLKIANQKLKDLVDIDDLTGLYNMRSLYQRLDHEISRARRSGRPVAVVMMDLDDFKIANDSHDHLFGSFILSAVGEIIKQNIRSIDFAARYGGDEFLVVLTDSNIEGCYTFSERLRLAIAEKLFANDKHSMRITSSFGFTVCQTGQNIDSRSVVRGADRALYEAKYAGKDCIKYFDIALQKPLDIDLPLDPKLLRKK